MENNNKEIEYLASPILNIKLSKEQINGISALLIAEIEEKKRNGIDKFIVGGDYSQLIYTRISSKFYRREETIPVLYFAGNIPMHIDNAQIYDLNEDRIRKYLELI